MKNSWKAAGLLCLAMAFACFVAFGDSHNLQPEPTRGQSPLLYEKDGQMRFPSHYREWIFLASGFNMSYSDQAPSAEQSALFDNVFVDPASYRSFRQTGTWPDRTVLVLEVRNGQNRGSINKAGHFQSSMNHFEAHVKDEARFPGKWAFFGFSDEKSGKLIPQNASCYSCHADHAAVDTTFVQFYPTLLPIARAQSTFSAAYLKESSANPAGAK